MNKVFNKIKEIRKSLNLTQAEFATAAGVNASDVSKLENGEKKFIDIDIIQFLKKKGVDINKLFDESINNLDSMIEGPTDIHTKYPPKNDDILKDKIIQLLEEKNKLLEERIRELEQKGVSDTNVKSA